MRSILASIFRLIFQINFFRKKYFAFHQYLFSRYPIFRGVKKDVLYRNSFKMNLNLDDWIQQQIYFLGDYEKNEIDYLYHVLKEGDCFIDIGGNIGLFSLNASKLIGMTGRVYAFEAFKPNYEIFSTHLKANHIQNVTLEHLAVSSETGFLEIFYNDTYDNAGMASSYLPDYTTKEIVQSIDLDSYVRSKNLSKIDLIKIDIEGGEYSALLGMSEVLNNFKPKIIIEINHVALKNSGHSEEEIKDFFSAKNYQLVNTLSKNENSYNAVFEFVGS
ncbi:FkbM family methyltransferase [Chryseobacterium taihuense]|uniref:Methyltransferase, FkbM family n=1 Tax=Chryseobacterium taihuense TaxID=1141221 RepID=A0ABY0QTE8_9FLAO|nr:FkbM family methyltransferase [Chryseobacterium taihuense]SDL84616.1 methyltransferase, FkbM family [Chryseobacterium taihuense]